jgi:putative PIN family toxin of toxin-antitoxin system
MRVTCDANLLVRAALHRGGLAYQILEQTTLPPHALIVSPALLVDVHRVLHYPRIQKRYGISDQDIDDFVQMLLAVADVVLKPTVVPAIAADPDDDIVLATAVDGRADVLPTLDQHFSHPVVQAYCAAHGIRVVNDVEVLHLLRGTQGGAP